MSLSKVNELFSQKEIIHVILQSSSIELILNLPTDYGIVNKIFIDCGYKKISDNMEDCFHKKEWEITYESSNEKIICKWLDARSISSKLIDKGKNKLLYSYTKIKGQQRLI